MRNILLPLKTMLFDEGGVEEVFSHIRNLLIATVVIAAGSYGIKQGPDVEIFGVLNLEIAGIGVGAIGFTLVGLNLIDGLVRLSKIGSSFALRIALVVLYLFFSMRLVQSPHLLSADAERALKPDPSQSFRECAPKQPGKDYCPDMVVIPAGSFLMGSLATDGDCRQGVIDSRFGRGQEPVINVTWNDANASVKWLSKVTGKPYRLLSDAEYEYATRAGTQTAYPWGNDIGHNNAPCNGCGSKWDNGQTAPVGSFAPNKFGLYDMVGNVFEWTEDCPHNNYDGAPTDDSAWIDGGNCKSRVIRGSPSAGGPGSVRSAFRFSFPTDVRDFDVGFRVGRTVIAP